MSIWGKIKDALKQPEIERPGISMLLKNPRTLSVQEVEQALASIDITSPVEADGERWLCIPDLFIAILQVPEPFLPKERCAEYTTDLRLLDALLNHEAFVSVSMEDWAPEEEIEAARRTIWKLTSKLVNEDTLVLWDEMSNQMCLPTPELLSSLAAAHENTFRLVSWDSTCPNGGDDERLAAAMSKAQESFPQLRLAFEIEEVDNAIARSSFTDRNGSVEHLWFDVTSIGEDTVSGLLSNEPHILVGFEMGSEVTVPVEQVSDWMYLTTDGRTVGGFL